MTAEFHWCEPPWLHCRCCGGSIEPEKNGQILCKSCARKCANWVRRHSFEETAVYEGPGWHVDNLPDDDPRTIAYMACLDKDDEERNRIWSGEFTDDEVTDWLAHLLMTPSGRAWLNVA